MWRIRHFLESIRSLFNWFKIIWKDRQWDHSYYETLLLHKIKLQRDYFIKRKYFVGWEREVKWMNVCIILLQRLQNSEYWGDEYDKLAPSRRGFSEKYTNNQEYMDYVYGEKYTCVYAALWEDKVRTLFWKIFIWRYEYWWD